MKHVLMAVAATAAGFCGASDGEWNVDSNGNWSDAANWVGGVVADGAGSSASFANAMTADRTATIDGAEGSRTVGTLYFGAMGRTFSINANNNGFLTMDNVKEDALIHTSADVPEVKIQTPMLIAGNGVLNLNNGHTVNRSIILSGRISGTNVLIRNIGSNGDSSFRLEGTHDFTGEVWAQGISRLNVGVGSVEEQALGDPRNILRVFPGGRLTLGGQAVMNPLRTIIMESDGSTTLPRFHNPGENNEKKHVPAPITGEGGVQIQSNILLSGANDFEDMLDIEGGTFYMSSDANLGKGPLRIQGRGATFGVIGRQFSSFGDRAVDFTIGNNGGATLGIMDPNHTFVLDRTLALSLNSAGAPSLAKAGPGELRITAPQTLSNGGSGVGRMLAVNGGTLTLDYGAGASLSVMNVGNNRVGFTGGTLRFDATGITNDVVQYVGNFRLDGDGGVLRVDPSNAAHTFTLNMGDFTTVGHSAYGGALWLKTSGDPAKTILTSTEANHIDTGIIGNGRVVYQEDWPATDPDSGVISAFAGYAPLPASDDPTLNALLQGGAALPGSLTVNTLKIAPTQQAQTLAIDNSATLALNDGALLFTGDFDYTITGGKLRSDRPAASDFFLHHAGSGTLTLDTTLATGNGISSFTKTGPGKVVLAKDLSVGGRAIIADGILEIASQENLNQASGTLADVVSLNTANTFTCAMAALPDGFLPGSQILGRNVTAISGSAGAWTITLDNNANATLNLGNANFTTSAELRNNGTLRVAESMALSRAVVLGGNGGAFDVADGKTLIVNNRNGGVMIVDNTDPVGDGIVRGNNTIQMGSGLFIRRGIYEANTGDGLSACGANPLVFGGGDIATYRVYGNNKSHLVAELSSENPAAVVENGATGSGASLFAVLNGADNHFAGTIRDGGAGALRFLKGGAGKLTLSGDSDYTGATAINGGILEITGSIASATTLNRGSITGDGTLDGDLVVNAGATVLPTQPTPFVTGGITLNGALEIADIETLAPAAYTLFTCGGGIADNGVAIANKPQTARRTYSLRVVDNGSALSLRIATLGSLIIAR